MPGGIVKGGGLAVEVEDPDPFELVEELVELVALVSTSLKALFFLVLLPEAAAAPEDDGEGVAGEAVVSIGG
jgi:hypothetical protein